MTGQPGATLRATLGARLGTRFRRPGPPTRALAADPFAVLGLDSGADVTDDEVRAVWRRIAAATHPDRADGGDPARFAAAAAAYTDLRTRFGRGEARAALGQAGVRPRAGLRPRAAVRAGRGGAAVPVASRRHAWLALRVITAAMVAAVAIVVSGRDPAGPALAAGAATWLLVTARHDLDSLVRSVRRRCSARLRRPRSRRSGQPGSWPVATGRVASDDQADQEPT